MGKLSDTIAALVALENQVKAAAVAADARDVLRVYEWRPSKPPETPAIWNWIDPSDHELVDTARDDDLLIVTATIGVKPSDMGESMGRLTRLTDVFCDVVDPALRSRPVLAGSARSARRVVMGQSFDVFNDVPVMCMDFRLRVQLAHITG